jgi:hypothetical protein
LDTIGKRKQKSEKRTLILIFFGKVNSKWIADLNEKLKFMKKIFKT